MSSGDVAAPGGAPPPMSYRELPVQPELQPWLAAHWCFRVRPGEGAIEHTVPLTGGAMLSVAVNRLPAEPAAGGAAPPAAVVAGPRSEPFRTTVRGGEVFWGSHLWPGVGPVLLGLDAGQWHGLVGSALPAGLVFGEERTGRLVASLRGAEEAGPRQQDKRAATGPPEGASEGTLPGEGVDDGSRDAACRILDQLWMERLEEAAPLDPEVMGAVFRILARDGGGSVGELAAEAGLSPRQLRRRFRAAVGLSPKELARVQRMRASAVALVRSGPSPWVELAADHGYADQAHLVREYRRLLGLTPGGFRRHVDRIGHGTLLR